MVWRRLRFHPIRRNRPVIISIMPTPISSSLICGPCARSQSLPQSEVFRTGCWTGTGVLKYIATHSYSHPHKPTGSYFFETDLPAVQERARQCYTSAHHYFEEEKPGKFRAWQPNALHSGQMEYLGVPGDASNTLKFVLLDDVNNRHGMLALSASLPTGFCATCGRQLPYA